MGEPQRPLGGGPPAHLHGVRPAGPRDLPGAAPVVAPGLVRAGLAAAAPGLAGAAFALLPAEPALSVWRCDAAGLATCVAAAAFVRPRAPEVAAALAGGPVLLGVAHAAVRAAHGGGVSGAVAIAFLAAGVALAVAGLRALGRRLGCPPAGAAAVSAGVLWLACAGVWWADDLAARVPPARRSAVREAVLAVDPFTAAAYGAADFNRLQWRPVYDATVVATTTVRLPRAGDAALPWGALGALAAAAALWTRRRAGRPSP